MTKPNPVMRETILDQARQLMLAHGYSGTSIDRVCAAAGVTKGAFFHYFKTKKALGLAVLARHGELSMRAYQGAAFLQKSDALDRLLGYVDFTAALVRHPVRDACLFGMFSQELADSLPDFRNGCAAAFAQWAGGLRDMLDGVKRKRAPKTRIDTEALAEHFIAVFEGALILAKAKGDVGPVRVHLDQYKDYLKSVFATATRRKRV